ncbi:MAG: DNA polymerase I [Candidatus Aminicenantes bacterium]|jgi:DNA polymerase-1
MAKKKIYLIDGNSLLYRSYYAIQRLSNSKGFPTNGIYGFLTMLRKLINQHNPDYLGIVFDTKGPTIRHETFKDYKAHRKPMPDDLVVQIPMLKKILKALNIPFLEHEKYEADDLLGSLARLAPSHKINTVIVSTDKDLLQLVDKSTTVYNPTKEQLLDEKGVKESFGVSPSQVIDVLALWGDPSDNIPGVPSVGEKTSKALIDQFGSLDNIMKGLERIEKESLRNKIKDNLDQLNMSRDLVTIEKNLDVSFDPKDFILSEPNYRDLLPLLQEMEFSSLLSEYLRESDQTQKEYAIIWEEAQLMDLVSRIHKVKAVALDTETDSPYPTRARLVGISFSLEKNKAYYLPLGHDYPNAPKQIAKKKAIALLADVISNPKIRKIGQNIKYDAIVLGREGLPVKGIDRDTMVLSYLLEPNWGKHNLDKLALSYLHVKTIPYHKIAGKGRDEKTLNAVAVKKVAPYACQDADLALQLSETLWPRVCENKLEPLYRRIELPLISVLTDMEMWGVLLDPSVLKDLSAELDEELNRLKTKIFDISGEVFNLNSPQQLARILFDKLKLPSSRKTRITKGYSTSFDILQDLSKDFPIAMYALEHRQLAKLKSTYADALPQLIHPETGRIHTSYNQTVAATGRLSSSDPNLQNIPAREEWGPRFRRAFVPADGHLLLSADYSQIELRVLAHLSGDKAMIETFLQDQDVHQETANRVFGSASSLFQDEQRRRAKIINFSMVYGASAFSLGKELGASTAEAQQFINLYFEKYPNVKKFLEQSVKEARDKGFSETLFGRKRPVPELRHRNSMVQQAGRRIALNTPIQGTAADLMKKAMIDIWRALRENNLKSKMILQVHDELVFEVPDDEQDELEALVKKRMENVFSLDVPLKVHLGWGINWAEAK